MQEDLKKRLKDVSEAASDIAAEATDLAGSAAQVARDAYERFGLKSKFDTVSKATIDLLENSGAIDAANQISKTTGEHLDTLSGAKLLALLEASDPVKVQ